MVPLALVDETSSVHEKDVRYANVHFKDALDFLACKIEHVWL